MIRMAAAFAATLLAANAASAKTPMELRMTAMEVLQRKAGVERVASNCRWIRGTDIRGQAKTWADDNLDFFEAAERVAENQGGLTRARKALAEALGAHAMQQHSSSREACTAFGALIAKGDYDLPRTMPLNDLRELTATRYEEPSPTIWVVEQRRGKNGSLYHEARRYGLDDGMEACDRNAAAKGHIWTRANTAPDGSPLPGIDMESWMQECVASEGNPLGDAAQGGKG